MIHYDLSTTFHELKENLISSILFALKDFPVGKYVMQDGDMTVIITEDGNDSIDFIEWNGGDIIFNTDNNRAISFFDLYFEDLLYFYEILEGDYFVVATTLKPHEG